jgi:FixJ family two-component response regulator
VPRVIAVVSPVTQVPVIAVVDDDPSVRRSLRRLVESAGYTVHAFASAGAFLGALSDSHPACLVLDVHLDGMDGFALQARLVEIGVGVPIIFITAYDNAPTRARIERSGAAGHLWKPFDAAALLGLIHRVVRGLAEGPTGSPGTVGQARARR